jgi:hypothetical protein
MKWLAVALLVSAAASQVQPAKVDGEWNWRMNSPMGEVTARVVLRTDGTKLTGTFQFSETRRLEIEDGTIAGDELRFTVRRSRSEGGAMVYEMMGRVEPGGQTIRGTARTPFGDPPQTAEWVMQRAIPAPKGGPASGKRPSP